MRSKGRYVYGVADSERAVNLGPIGIEGNEVYTVPDGRFCAIVHRCSAEPYQSSDQQMVKQWVEAHQAVLDAAKDKLGTIVPLGFDTILQSQEDAVSLDQLVVDWLRQDSERLEFVMRKIRGRDEYAVRIFYDRVMVARRVSEDSPEIRRIKEDIASSSPGLAYLWKQKVERAVKVELERLAGIWSKDLYARVRRHCEDVMTEKASGTERDKAALISLSCLVAKEKVDVLGEELEKINNTEGFSVHFSGPWPPYSFVAKPVAHAK